MRYVDFMETKGGRELAMFALERATKVFSKVNFKILPGQALNDNHFTLHLNVESLFFN